MYLESQTEKMKKEYTTLYNTADSNFKQQYASLWEKVNNQELENKKLVLENEQWNKNFNEIKLELDHFKSFYNQLTNKSQTITHDVSNWNGIISGIAYKLTNLLIIAI